MKNPRNPKPHYDQWWWLNLSKAGLISCKNINSFAVVGSKLLRSFAIVNPAAEKTLSDGAEVAGIASSLNASLEISGNCCALILHQSNGLLNDESSFFIGKCGSLWYKPNSAVALHSGVLISSSLTLLLVWLLMKYNVPYKKIQTFDCWIAFL